MQQAGGAGRARGAAQQRGATRGQGSGAAALVLTGGAGQRWRHGAGATTHVGTVALAHGSTGIGWRRAMAADLGPERWEDMVSCGSKGHRCLHEFETLEVK